MNPEQAPRARTSAATSPSAGVRPSRWAQLALACVPWLLLALPLAAAELRPDQRAFRELFRELVETDTSHPSGDCTLAATRMAARLRAAGYAADEVDVFAPEGHPRDGGLVARLAGRDPSLPALLLVAHIDVVPARREDWGERDPFVLDEADGFFYGRGVIDDKALSSIWTDTLVRFRREGFAPLRTIKLALTCGEEGGSVNGVKWLLRHRPDALQAGFALNEGGYGMAGDDGRPVALHMAVGEKASRSYLLEARNPGGHSSQPRRENAIYDLADALLRLRDLEFPVRYNDVNRMFFARMGALVGGETGQAMARLAVAPGDAEALARVAAHPVYVGMLRTTCVPTLLEGGHAANALPQRAQAHLQCRLFPGDDPAEVEATIGAAIADPAITVTEVGRHGDDEDGGPVLAVPPPLDPAVFGPAERLAEVHFPGVPLVPKLLTAGTDGRYLSAAGIPTYGVPGIALEADGNGAHGVNERVRVSSLFRGRDYLYDLVRHHAVSP